MMDDTAAPAQAATAHYVTTAYAAQRLGVTRGYLQHAALEERAIARRLRMTKPGRDWIIPIDALEAEVDRRRCACWACRHDDDGRCMSCGGLDHAAAEAQS